MCVRVGAWPAHAVAGRSGDTIIIIIIIIMNGIIISSSSSSISEA